MSLKVNQIVVTYPQDEYIKPIYLGKKSETDFKVCLCAHQMMFCVECNKILMIKNTSFKDGSKTIYSSTPTRRNTFAGDTDIEVPDIDSDEEKEEEIELKSVKMDDFNEKKFQYDFQSSLGHS